MLYFFLWSLEAALALEGCLGFDFAGAPADFLCEDLRDPAPFEAALAWATSA